jgi:arabinofuranan 3-O-arabinosyltransferase
VVDWSTTHRLVKIGPHASAQVLVMRENTNRGWRATAADGRVLTPIVADGWQQGFLVPAGVAGDITIAFVPDGTYRLALLVGAALLLAVLMLAIRPGRRVGTHSVAVRKGGSGGGAYVAIGAVALIAVGGAIGAMLVLVALVLLFPALRPGFARWPRRRGLRGLGIWLAVGLIGVGGWALMTSPDPHHVGWVQAFGVLVVGVLWLSAVPTNNHRGGRSAAPPLRARPLSATATGVAGRPGGG